MSLCDLVRAMLDRSRVGGSKDLEVVWNATLVDRIMRILHAVEEEQEVALLEISDVSEADFPKG